MLEPGPDTASLASLATYPALRSTCGTVFAQTAALCAGLSTALQQRLEQRQRMQQGPLVWLARAVASLITCSCRGTASNASSKGQADPVLLGVCWGAAKLQLLAVLHHETQQYWAALAAAGPGRPFKLDPAASIVSLMFFCTLTLAVIEAGQELQEAGQAVLYGDACAAKQTTTAAAGAGAGAGTADAAQKVAAKAAKAPAAAPAGDVEEAAAQFDQHADVPASSGSSTAGSTTAARPAALGVAASSAGQAVASSGMRTTTAAVDAAPLSAVVVHSTAHSTAAGSGQQHSHGTLHTSTHTSSPPAAAPSSQQQHQPNRHRPGMWSRLTHPFRSNSAAAAPRGAPTAALSSSVLLLEVLLCAAIFRRLARAVLQELPAALKSKQGEQLYVAACAVSKKFGGAQLVWLHVLSCGHVAGYLMTHNLLGTGLKLVVLAQMSSRI
jgi:hypothetical protein